MMLIFIVFLITTRKSLHLRENTLELVSLRLRGAV